VQKIEVLDAATGTVLAGRIISNFSGGQYHVWALSGHIRFRITRISGPNAVVSGLFFGGATNSVSAASGRSNHLLVQSRVTRNRRVG
jgi:hypothetical protein